MTRVVSSRIGATVVAAVAVIVVLAGATATVIAQSGVYQATSRAVLLASPMKGRPNIGYDAGVPAMFSVAIESYAVLVYSESFLRRVIDRQHLDLTSDRLRAAIRVTSPHTTTIVDFEVRTDDPDVSTRAATAVAEEFAVVVPELEAPTPITVHVIDAAPATAAFDRSIQRTGALSIIAAVTAVGITLYLRRRAAASSYVRRGPEPIGETP